MTTDLAAAYKSGSQRARVVTEFWGEHNLYCPNCSPPKLTRQTHNTKVIDFCCPACNFKYQLKGQKTRFGNSINDGAYESMMAAIRRDDTPNFYFMHYDLATWSVKNLLLIPHFAFPPSAIIKRPPLSATARRAGWIGCNIALSRIPADARIAIVTTIARSASGSDSRQFAQFVSTPEEVRAKFRKVKPLEKISTKQRGWTLDVLNIVRRIGKSIFTDEDIYTFAPELEKLHPDNRHIRDKIRQQLPVLRDTGFLEHIATGEWRLK
jgi:type II restriction enzyme